MRALTLSVALALGIAPAPFVPVTAAGQEAPPAADPDPAAAARRVQVAYEVYAGGLHVLDARMEVSLGEAAYSLDFDLVTKGLVSGMARWSADNRVEGRIVDGRLAPVDFRMQTEFEGRQRTTRLRYDPPGRFAAFETEPPVDPEETGQVAEADIEGAIDIMSGLVQSLRAVEATDSCDQRVKIYDGRRRYDLVFTDRGGVTLEASSVNAYQGPARRCTLVVEQVAGTWRRHQRRWFTEGDDGVVRSVPLTAWIARVDPAAPPAPVRIEVDTPYGKVLMHLVRFRVAGG